MSLCSAIEPIIQTQRAEMLNIIQSRFEACKPAFDQLGRFYQQILSDAKLEVITLPDFFSLQPKDLRPDRITSPSVMRAVLKECLVQLDRWRHSGFLVNQY